MPEKNLILTGRIFNLSLIPVLATYGCLHSIFFHKVSSPLRDSPLANNISDAEKFQPAALSHE